jgi:hypothetical protein
MRKAATPTRLQRKGPAGTATQGVGTYMPRLLTAFHSSSHASPGRLGAEELTPAWPVFEHDSPLADVSRSPTAAREKRHASNATPQREECGGPPHIAFTSAPGTAGAGRGAATNCHQLPPTDHQPTTNCRRSHAPLPTTSDATPPSGSLHRVYVVDTGTLVPSRLSLTDTSGSRKGALRDAGQLAKVLPCGRENSVHMPCQEQ